MLNNFTPIKENPTFLLIFSSLLLLFSISASAQENEQEISKAVYFTANTGLEKDSKADLIFSEIVKSSQKDKDAAIVVIGNITREVGYPKNKENRKKEEEFLTQNLLQPLKEFNGNVIFTPGKNEWNNGGHKNIDDLESFLQDNSKSEFWPNDGCPIERESLSDEVELVMVDSQWYIENWDHYPYINNKCELKTREQFFAQFKDELKDEQNKTVIVAIHHPVLSANRKGFFGRMGGFSNQAFYNTQMQELMGRLESLASQFEDVIFVSGNHKNLQYLEDDGIPQIISGASGEIEKTRPEEDKGYFASKNNGFAKLIAYKDGNSVVEMYELQDGKATLVYTKEIKRKKAKLEDFDYHTKDEFGPTYKASIYTDEETDKSNFYKWAWGDHYRDIYSKKIEAPVLFLDTLPNNMKASRAGGGNQSRTLRIKNDEGHEYNIRELRKSAVRFIQSNIKDHYVVDYMRNTLAEDIITDFYTTAHPYAPFAVNGLSKSLDIYHANPEVVYVPKQKSLGRFNDTYGDKLYMFEEQVGDDNKNFETFGNSDDIISTSDILLEIQDNKDAKIDEGEYIKARIFDMLIGDWDRHQDQWRWSKFEKDGKDIYKPIPRDRDQAFPKYDGPIIALLKVGVPPLRVMQNYEPTIKNTKWFNLAGYPLDKSFINTSSWADWKKQAQYIQDNLTDEAIDNAFAELPADTQDESIEEIKKILKQRRENILDITKEYYDYFKKFETVIGTNEDNKFLITRKDDGITQIDIEEDGETIFSNEYSAKETKEIWIYGLDGDDEFKVEGEGNNLIKLKILGGEENDIYDFDRKAKTKVYDYKSKNNTFKNVGSKRLTDSYNINNYDPTKKIHTSNVILPSIGFDPDAGFKAGLSNTFTTYGLVRNPFTSQHTIGANFYSATQGFEFSYYGEFAHIFYNWNLGIDARYTSPTYAINFFGVGNNTTYNNDTDRDFNRVPIIQWHVAPSLIYKKNSTLMAYFKPSVESYEVDNSFNNFIGEFYEEGNDVFENQMYAGAEVGFNFNNKGSLVGYPRRGMELDLKAGYKSSINNDYNNQFAYLNPTVSFVYPIHESGAATLATRASADFILGDFGEDYEFYYAATVGGNESLRGFRNDRFLGETSFFHSTDLRVGITKFRTNYVPLRLGVTGGFDYGRVWIEGEDSNKIHTSYGGSVFLNGFNAFTANVGYYLSDEDNRLIFTLGFRF